MLFVPPSIPYMVPEAEAAIDTEAGCYDAAEDIGPGTLRPFTVMTCANPFDVTVEIGQTLVIFKAGGGGTFIGSPVSHFGHIPGIYQYDGGDVTGTIDEPIRHSITKFSHIHFTSNKEASERIIKMGENPKYIFTVGSPVMDNIITTNYISDEKLSEKFGLDFSKPFFIILQHTVTTEINEIDQYIKNILSVVKEKDIQTVIIHGNADAGSQKISKIIKNSKINQVYSINFEEYINLLKRSAALIGNSSSGIIETPFLRVPTINIGTRQQGRLRAKNIIDVGYDKKDIKKAIEKVQFDKKFLSKVKNCSSLYGNGNSAKKIIKILTILK